jgi:nucleoside-diphosphate-sugar epimerase
VNLWAFIRRMLETLDLPPPRARIPYIAAYALGAAMETLWGTLKLKGEPTLTRYMAVRLAKTYTYSIARARADLDYKPAISQEEGLKQVYAWIAEKGIPEAI